MTSPAVADILAALAEPALNDLDAAMIAAGVDDPAQARWAAIEGMLDVWLAHRHLLRMNLNDLALAAAGSLFARFRDAMLRANALVAGPDADFAGRVRAAQAIAMLADPVALFADASTDALRASVLHGVHRLLDDDTTLAARSRRGRPGVMTSTMAEAARRMHDAGSTAAEIAATLGVSRATVYRHLSSSQK